MNQLEIVKSDAGAVAKTPATPSPAEILQAVLERGVTTENVAAVREILGLCERMQDRDAAKQFAAAFSQLQQELPKVKAMRQVISKGQTLYTYASYEDIMAQLQPLLTKHGFSVRFSSRADERTITMVCTVMHSSGHSVSNEFTCRVGKGPPNASEAQSDGAAGSLAQRNALCDAFNIIVRRDGDDPRNVGDGEKVTADQAFELERRVAETNSNRDAFLRLGEADLKAADPFKTIAASRYAELDALLAKKEHRK